MLNQTQSENPGQAPCGIANAAAVRRRQVAHITNLIGREVIDGDAADNDRERKMQPTGTVRRADNTIELVA